MDGETPELEIGVTGSAWVGHGRRSAWSLVRESFAKAEREILIAAYSLSETSSDFFSILNGSLSRGIRIHIIVNRFKEQSDNARNSLVTLKKKYGNRFILQDFHPSDRREDLHAKLIIVDHKIALVGSANLTWKGLMINHELLIRITGTHASEIGDLVDNLSRYQDTRMVQVDE